MVSFLDIKVGREDNILGTEFITVIENQVVPSSNEKLLVWQTSSTNLKLIGFNFMNCFHKYSNVSSEGYFIYVYISILEEAGKCIREQDE